MRVKGNGWLTKEQGYVVDIYQDTCQPVSQADNNSGRY